tara:strand:- start:2163 stop:2459 length:297 start_codon:yes stop_codon:yes gene_type:complete
MWWSVSRASKTRETNKRVFGKKKDELDYLKCFGLGTQKKSNAFLFIFLKEVNLSNQIFRRNRSNGFEHRRLFFFFVLLRVVTTTTTVAAFQRGKEKRG